MKKGRKDKSYTEKIRETNEKWKKMKGEMKEMKSKNRKNEAGREKIKKLSIMQRKRGEKRKVGMFLKKWKKMENEK